MLFSRAPRRALLFYPQTKERIMKMKNFISAAISLTLTLTLILCLAACTGTDAKEGLWESATYTEDTTLGNGAKTATVEYRIGEEKITFTIKTDKETLGAALNEHALLEGKDGLYTKINGVTADWNVDGSYWGFYIDGQYAMTGVDDTPIDEAVIYSLVYTK